MGVKHSLEDMWNVIEQFGINRKIIDPHDLLKYEEVEELYRVIEEKRKTEEQINLLREAID